MTTETKPPTAAGAVADKQRDIQRQQDAKDAIVQQCPTMEGMSPWLQYGPLGAICFILMGLLVWIVKLVFTTTMPNMASQMSEMAKSFAGAQTKAIETFSTEMRAERDTCERRHLSLLAKIDEVKEAEWLMHRENQDAFKEQRHELKGVAHEAKTHRALVNVALGLKTEEDEK